MVIVNVNIEKHKIIIYNLYDYIQALEYRFLRRSLPMKFQPERLIQLRNTLNINKAEAARRLNISPMVYGRYENGQREPSYPTVGFIAQTFNCNGDFL